jgi:CRP-like cAMP-binding protein
LFSACTRRQLEHIDELGAPLFVPAGRTLATSGTRGQDCFVVVSGVASATRNDIVVGTIENGTVGGELALLDGAVRSATVVSSSWMRLLVLTPREFEELLETAPCVEDLVLHTAARRRKALADVGAPAGV